MKTIVKLCIIYSVALASMQVVCKGQVISYERMLPLTGLQRVELVVPNDDGGYFLVGRQGNFLSVIRATSQGDTIFTRGYSFPVLVNSALPRAAHYDSIWDKLYIFGTGSASGGALNGFMAKFDTMGSLEQFSLYNQASFGAIDAVTSLPNGEFLLTGARNFFSGGNIDIFLTRIDSIGNIIKDTSYSKPFPQEAFSIEPLYDGSYLIGGVTGTAQGPAAYALQVDLWGRVIRDTVIQTPTSPFNNQNVRFRQLADDSWSITGTVGTNAPFLYRVGAAFQPIVGTYSTSAVTNNRYLSYPTADSGFLYIGSTGSSNVFLRKFGVSNAIQWTVPFFIPSSRIRLFNDVIIGYTGAIFGGGAIADNLGSSQTDYYWGLIQSSETPFLKNLCRSAPVASFSVQDSGGVFILRNTSATGLQYNPTQTWEWYNPNTLQTSSDSVLILPGNLPPGYPMVLRMRNYYGCTDTLQADVLQVLGGALAAAEDAYRPTALYPIPARGVVYVEPGSRHRGSLHAQVLSPDGRLLGRYPLTAQGPTAVQVQGMAAGVYLLRVQSSAHSEVLRWVKE